MYVCVCVCGICACVRRGGGGDTSQGGAILFVVCLFLYNPDFGDI